MTALTDSDVAEMTTTAAIIVRLARDRYAWSDDEAVAFVESQLRAAWFRGAGRAASAHIPARSAVK